MTSSPRAVQERMSLQLADAVVSPTQHMISYFKSRGWTLPKDVAVIPTPVPDLPAAMPQGGARAVWRLAYYSRSTSFDTHHFNPTMWRAERQPFLCLCLCSPEHARGHWGGCVVCKRASVQVISRAHGAKIFGHRIIYYVSSTVPQFSSLPASLLAALLLSCK